MSQSTLIITKRRLVISPVLFDINLQTLYPSSSRRVTSAHQLKSAFYYDASNERICVPAKPEMSSFHARRRVYDSAIYFKCN